MFVVITLVFAGLAASLSVCLINTESARSDRDANLIYITKSRSCLSVVIIHYMPDIIYIYVKI